MVGVMVFIGLSNGTQPILSYNYGAGHLHRVQGTLNRLLAVSLSVGLLFFIVLCRQAGAMATLFIPGHAGALALTLRVARIISWSMLFMPVGIVVSMFFTSMEKAGNSMVVAVSRGLVFTVLGLVIFPIFWGELGIWITLVFAEGTTALVAVLLVYRWKAKFLRQEGPGRALGTDPPAREPRETKNEQCR